jgi:hypothetical protein
MSGEWRGETCLHSNSSHHWKMKKINITIHHSIYINRPREAVWDFTQDYSLRTEWDKTVIEAKVLQTTPRQIVELKTSGNTMMTFVYKVNDRPIKQHWLSRTSNQSG